MLQRICKLLLIFALLWPGVSWGAAPTLGSYTASTFSDSVTTSEVTGTLTWGNGDLIVVLGVTEDDGKTLNTPTATGLSFTAVAGTPTTTTNKAKVYAWTATAGSASSGAITAGTDTTAAARGIAAFAFSGSTGIGGTSISAALGTATTQSLTRTGTNSHVVQVWGDWNAVNDTTVTGTPSGETQRVAQFISGTVTFFVLSWGDQGASGTTSYGFTGHAGGAEMSAITREVLGDGAGGGGATVRSLSLLGVGQ